MKPEKLQLEIARLNALKEITKEVISNPIVEIIAGYTIIEALQKEGYLGNLSGTVAEGLIGGTIVAQQIAPLMPYLGQAGSSILPALIPLLAGG
jgi:hypothetical protein